MKKFALIITLLCALGVTSYAQIAPPFPQHLKGGYGTTMTNAVSDTMTYSLTGFYSNIVFQLTQVKTSGTVAGTAYLQVSQDNVGWLNPVGLGLDTATLGNVATQAFSWNVGTNNWQYYRLIVNTTGTQVSVPTGFIKYTAPNCGR